MKTTNTPKFKKTNIACLVTLTIMLTACGGGGEGTTTSLINQNNGNSNSNSNSNNGSISTYQGNGVIKASGAMGEAPKETPQGYTGANVVIGVIDSGMMAGAEISNNNIDTFLDYNGGTYTSLGSGVSKENGGHGSNIGQIIMRNTGSNQKFAVSNAMLDTAGAAFNSASDLYQYYSGSNQLKIVNNSWVFGKNADTSLPSHYYDLSATGTAYIAAFDAIDQNDLLMIMAAGNDQNATNSVSSSHAPLLDTKYADNFLTVTGGNWLDGNRTKSNLTNDCGVAAQWCLTAPMYYENLYNPLSVTYSNGIGSSYATAYVSSVAAKVYEKYNWMTAANLQRTLLSTATDIESAGVDSKSGWGMVNLNKAINGYGQFAWGTENFSIPNGVTSTFSNDITGGGGFNLNGTGKLILSGNNTFTGDINVNNSILQIDGTNTNSHTYMNSASKLMTGVNVKQRSLGNVILNNANLDVYEPLNVTSLTSDSTSNNSISLGSSIKATDTMTFDNDIYVNRVRNGYTVNNNEYYSILKADNGLNFNADVQSTNGLINVGVMNLTGNELSVQAARNESGAAVVASAGGTFMGVSAASRNMDSILTHYENLNQSGNLTAAQAQAYSAVLNSAASGNHQAALASIVHYEMDDSLLKNAAANANLETVSANSYLLSNMTGKDGVFVYGNGSNAKTSFDGVDGERKSNQVGIGGKVTVAEGLSIGGMLTRSDSKWEETLQANRNNSSSLKTNRDSVTVSVSYDLAGVNTFAFAGYGNNNNKGMVGGEYRKFDGHTKTYGVGMNKAFNVASGLTLTPQIELQSVTTKWDIADVNIMGSNANLTGKAKQTTALASLSANYNLTDNVILIGAFGVEHDTDVKNTVKTNVAGLDLSNNEIYLPKTRYNASVGIAYTPTKNVTVGATIKYLKNSNWKETTAYAGVKYSF